MMFLAATIITNDLIKGHKELDKTTDEYLFIGWEEVCEIEESPCYS